jgi:dipeptidyl aminopeptidase/acylaminoacyl peptidase
MNGAMIEARNGPQKAGKALPMKRHLSSLLCVLAGATLGCGTSTPEPAALAAVTLSHSSLQAGASSTGTLTLTAAAPTGGAAVSLSSTHPSASPPATVTIAEGATTSNFTVTTTAVIVSTTATLTATYAGASRTATLTLQPDPCALRTPGAQWLAFSSKRGGVYDIYAMRADGTCLTQVTSGAGDDLFVTWSPAGTIAFMNARSGRMQIYVHDLGSDAERLLDVGDLTATSPAFSPDGTLVAFEGYEPGVTTVSDIYVVPAAGGTPTKLTTGQRYSAGPAWSPDGSTLYFVSNRVSGYNAWMVPAAGGTETMIGGTAGILGRPAATPDGTGIAYTLSAPGAAFSKVVLQTLSTGAVRTVTTQADGEPTIDRTGSRMVVTSFRGGNADLWLLDVATGAEVLRLTTDPGIDGAAAFGPFP